MEDNDELDLTYVGSEQLEKELKRRELEKPIDLASFLTQPMSNGTKIFVEKLNYIQEQIKEIQITIKNK